MAKGTARISKQVTLELSDAEGRYLKDLTQNYLGQGEEPPTERQLREALFTVLHILFKE